MLDADTVADEDLAVVMLLGWDPFPPPDLCSAGCNGKSRTTLPVRNPWIQTPRPSSTHSFCFRSWVCRSEHWKDEAKVINWNCVQSNNNM